MIHNDLKPNDRTPYIDESGEVSKIIKEFEEKRQSVWKSWQEFSRRFGGKQIYCDALFRGIVFGKDVPNGWVNLKTLPYNVFVPKGRSKERKEMDLLPHLPYWDTFNIMLGFPGMIIDNSNRIIDTVYEQFGDVTIIHIPTALDKVKYKIPEGLREIKYSEYFKLKEKFTVEI